MFITGLWGVVNNAGIDLYGDVEFLTLDLYRRVADVNLFGTISVTKTFLPLIRKSKGFPVIFCCCWIDWFNDTFYSNLFRRRVLQVFVLKACSWVKWLNIVKTKDFPDLSPLKEIWMSIGFLKSNTIGGIKSNSAQWLYDRFDYSF